MTPIEIKTAIKAIREEAGVNAYASLDINCDSAEPVSACLYPYGIINSRDGYLHVVANDFPEALANLRDAWAKFQDNHKLNATRKMALAIIRQTAEFGECTDAALRAEFDPGMVKRWGADACTMADEMAGKGPFSIIETASANAA